MSGPRLIAGWRHAHRLWTVRLALAMVVLNLAGALLALLADDFPSRIWLYLNAVLAAAIGVVRVLQQAGALDDRAAGRAVPSQSDEPAPADPGAATETLFRHPSER